MAVFDCYSPGQSPLQFNWVEGDISVSGQVNPSRIKRYMKGPKGKHFAEQGYEIHKIEGRWTILHPVERVDERTLRMDGKEFRYRIIQECAADRELWFPSVRYEYQPHAEVTNLTGHKWWELANWSMRLQLTLFLRYESIWEQTKDTGKRIKDSDTWGEHKLWKVTQFPGGDGKSHEH